MWFILRSYVCHIHVLLPSLLLFLFMLLLLLLPYLPSSRCLSGHSHLQKWVRVWLKLLLLLFCECCEVVASEIALVSASVVMWVWMKMWVWVGKCICECIISILIQERMMCNLDTCGVKNCSVCTRAVQSKCTQRVMLVCVHVCVWIGALIKHCRWGRSHGSGRTISTVEFVLFLEFAYI